MPLNQFLVLLVSGGMMFAAAIISLGKNGVAALIGLVSYVAIFLYMTYLVTFGKISFGIFNSVDPNIVSLERVIIFLVSVLAMSSVAAIIVFLYVKLFLGSGIDSERY